MALAVVYGAIVPGVRAQGETRATTGDALPRDVHRDSLSRLPLLVRDALDATDRKTYDAAIAANARSGGLEAAAILRAHGSGSAVRWQSPLGRPLTELAILVTGREHDQPYEWSLHQMEAMAVGLDPAVIDVVRLRKPTSTLDDRQQAVVQLGHEMFALHHVSAATYARALKALGERNLVDVVELMSGYAATATRLTVFNQYLPPGWKQFLPLPFSPPDDIHPDSRSRLPLRTENPDAPTPAATASLYGRTLAPEGTGPAHIARYGAGLASLEKRVGRRTIALAELLTARAGNSQYAWTILEPLAARDGVEPDVVKVVRDAGDVQGLSEHDAAMIQFSRELFGRHFVSAPTYKRMAGWLEDRDLADLVNLMAQYVADIALLTAFDQQVPPGQRSLLPVG